MHTYSFSFILTTVEKNRLKGLLGSCFNNPGKTTVDVGKRIRDGREQEDSRSICVKWLTALVMDYIGV